MLKFLLNLISDPNERELKKLKPKVEEINSFEAEISSLSDQQLKAKTEEFKKRLKTGESQEDILAEAFAVVRETAKRVTGMRHYDVQLMGALTLYQGRIAEMKTGEGKTLAATMPAYLRAVAGESVHIITVNDYLAERDSEWMGQIYEFLGLEVGVVLQDMKTEERKQAYQADILYGTNNQFGFDYLRDNMSVNKERIVQSDLDFAILDEVDSILIDEARTPLIISGPSQHSPKLYYKAAKIANRLTVEEDYEVDEKANSISFTDVGIDKIEELFKIDNLYDNKNFKYLHHINQAVKANALMKRDHDYIVKGDEVHIVDEFTGRLMSGRRFSNGLHQAIEAKEGVEIKRESQTLASITFQNYFRMYDTLSGMTGTAVTEAAEFEEIYDLDVVAIPTNKPVIREDHPDVIYQTEEAKFKAVVEDIKSCYQKGQPVLVGTVSINKSEEISNLLKRSGVPHEVLNAKHHEREAEIIKNAGQRGSVTIATNMAGRGTDIVLGDGVTNLGGLHVIATERHESRRIDNQLRGRSGRQGDPGSSRFYVSLEDDLMRLFGSDKISTVMDTLGVAEDQPIEHKLISRSLANAQKKVENRNFEIRKNILEYDDVLNEQRQVIYTQRKQVLFDEDMTKVLFNMVDSWLEKVLESYIDQDLHPDDWDFEGLAGYVKGVIKNIELTAKELEQLTYNGIKEEIKAKIKQLHQEKTEDLGTEQMERLEKIIMLRVIDQKWMDHIEAMSDLRSGIGLRAYGQRDPLVEYKMESFEMFKQMNSWIREDIIKYLFAIEVVEDGGLESRDQDLDYKKGDEVTAYDLAKGAIKKESQRRKAEQQQGRNRGQSNQQQQTVEPIVKEEEPGRNDPCPCGSGKKYKKCCLN